MERITAPENLRLAFALAERGRRARRGAAPDIRSLDAWLRELGNDIRNGEVEVGRFHRFVIHDPKRRVIHAPAFRERVLHQAVMIVAGPALERGAIFDSYACRVNKGVHRARSRAAKFASCFPQHLKLDIRSYFDSVSHEVLLQQLARCYKDPAFLYLLGRIVGSYETSPGTGLPIGSLTSQHFANAYLGPLDRFIKEALRVRGYVRYMDDLVLFGDDAAALRDRGAQVSDFAWTRLRLQVKEPRVVRRSHAGLPFLGARITPWAIYPTRRTRRRLRSKLAANEREYRAGRLGALDLQRRASALLGVVESMRCRDWRRRALLHAELEP